MSATLPLPVPLRPTPGAPAHARDEGRDARFSNVLRSEWAKLASVRSTWTTLLVTVVLGVGIGALIAHLAASRHSSGRFGGGAWDPTAASFRALTIAQLAIAVLGALAVTSEYSTGMIRTSLTAVPRRRRFVMAKALVFGAVALVAGEITSFAAFLLGQLAIGSSAPQATLATHDVLRAVIGAGLYLALVGLLATAVGTLLRNTAAAVSAMVALLFVLPGVVQALPASWSNAITEWWPTQAGSQVYAVSTAAHSLSAWAGLGVLAVFTGFVLLIATWSVERRDA